MTANGKIQVAKAFQHIDAHHDLSDSITGGNFHRIGYKGKVWKLMTGGETYTFIRPDDGTVLPYLDVVIIGIHKFTSRIYYGGVYQEDATSPPTCASLNGVVPDPGVPIPQHKECNGCPRSEWKPNRGGQDCKQHKRVAILLLPTLKTKPALKEALVEPVFFKVPPASLKSWRAYTDYLQDQGAPFQSVITRISFKPDRQFEMQFDYYASLTDSDAKLVLPLLDDPATKNILGSTPEYKQISSPALDTPQETGFAAAFGRQGQAVAAAFNKPSRPEHYPTDAEAPANPQTGTLPIKRGPGRPRKSLETAKPAEEIAEEAKVAELPAENETQASAFEDVENSELDSMMADVLGNKVNKSMS
jgi:hypothetical protein